MVDKTAIFNGENAGPRCQGAKNVAHSDPCHHPVVTYQSLA